MSNQPHRALRVAAFAGAMFALSQTAAAQMSAPELALRVDHLENEIRQLTGVVEQLQYRNQQLEQQLRRLAEDADGAKGGPRASASTAIPPAPSPPAVVAAAPAAPPVPSAPPRRS